MESLVHEEFEGEEGDLEDGDVPARLGFRGIPRWDEVVGMMIDRNLESRSKRAANHSHSGNHGNNRGPRDNRDNRGNRGGKRRS
jgi:hypothetical protein